MSNQFTDFRDAALLHSMAEALSNYAGRPLTFMEVCGTHTMSIMRYGIKGVLPPAIRLVSGPGCPVCVTESSYIDMAVELAKRPDVILATFGDLLRVPGSRESLQTCKSAGADVRLVYSPLDTLAICHDHPEKQVVFLSIGFETTTPVTALTVLKAQASGIRNLSFLVANKTMPRVLEALVADHDFRIDGFLFPGHVCAITGSRFYEEFCRRYTIPGVIAGFEPADILGGLLGLVAQASEERAEAETYYARVVRREGNEQAQQATADVFTPCAANWRGFGTIPGSGLQLQEAYAAFDAKRRFALTEVEAREPAGCRCSEILKGRIDPTACPLFGTVCLPTSPVGACMVSSEGACAAYYRYR